MNERIRAMHGAAMALVLAAGLAASGFAQPKATVEGDKLKAVEAIEIHVRVEAVDIATREVRIRHDDGIVETIRVGDTVQRLDEVKAGDDVHFRIYRSLTLALEKAPAGGAAESEVTGETRSKPAELPGGIKTRELEVVARIAAIDAAASTATLTGPGGRSAALQVDKDVLARLKVGDLVHATYTEALAVALTRNGGR